MMADYEIKKHTKINRIPSRGHYDEETVNSIIDSSLICHLGFVQNDRPFVIPCIHGRDGRTLYLHGAKASRLMDESGSGKELCITFTHVDGIVLARSLFHSSMNYRSVVAFGKGRALNTDEEKMHALDIVSEQLCIGRWKGARTPTEKELRATSVVAVDIDHASAKIRIGGPNDDEEDLAGPWWAGVLPVETQILAPIPSEDLKNNPKTPQHVQDRVSDIL
jgi:hypothetical protein|tara:strand:- start:666 stop:1328 length:663 start_codon:yes stop_codon:yes gene_type:complete